MTTLRRYMLGCVSDRSLEAEAAHAAQQGSKRFPKVKFGVSLEYACKGDALPKPVVDILVYIARQGVTTSDLFRRPGNPTDLKTIIKRLSEGKEIILTNYNFYTLASVIKKFLIKIPGGIFGNEVEEQLLSVLDLNQRMEQYERLYSIISSMSVVSQHLLSLLCGTWFRIVNHYEYNTMSAEAVAKSVAGSVFHTCADDPMKVERAVKVLEIMIDDFGVANMFGRKNIQYFADKTRTGIKVMEKFRYEYRFPADEVIPYDNSLRLFMVILQNEAEQRGFHLEKHAITEEEFFSNVRPRLGMCTADDGQNVVEICTPPSPQSLQPHGAYQRRLTDNSQYLANITSMSAPEVHRCSPSQDALEPNKPMYQSVSLSRFDHVKRKQMARMKKRSNWFLTANRTASLDAESVLGSRETSVGRSSIDAISSDALMSDITASDGGASDTPGSNGHRLSDIDTGSDGHRLSDIDTGSDGHRLSDVDSTYLDEPEHGQTPASEPVQRRVALLDPNFSNGSSTTAVKTTSPKEGRYLQGSDLTEREVRYFMVENWYGSVEDES